MPYIKQNTREYVDESIVNIIADIDGACDKETDRDGILNYVISRIVSESFSLSESGWQYCDVARAVAVFECAKLEFYRRVVGPKEDKAVSQNGDIPRYEAI